GGDSDPQGRSHRSAGWDRVEQSGRWAAENNLSLHALSLRAFDEQTLLRRRPFGCRVLRREL
ncbi:uncharacterized protein METZ01_LOCUS473242, partial [marine metagenome]